LIAFYEATEYFRTNPTQYMCVICNTSSLRRPNRFAGRI
jgi:hypothetical protein